MNLREAVSIQACERRARAAEMRAGGATFKAIGEALGVSKERAYQLLRAPAADETATCRDCDSQFQRRPWQVRKRDSQCSDCRNADLRTWRSGSESYQRAHRERSRRYRSEGRTVESDRRGARIARQRHPEKTRARRILRTEIEAGRIVRPSRCSRCPEAPPPHARGRRGIHGHHPDYTKPLDVVWLCGECHRAEHRALGFTINEPATP